jgi:hypothetical protein
VIFLSNIFKTPKSSRDRAKKREAQKEMLQESLQIKEKLTFERRKTLQLQKSFLM